MGCSSPKSGKPIEITIPDGFRGVFKIAEKPDAGIEIILVDDVYRVEIPDSGILEVADVSPFKRFHERKVVYRSGDLIPNGFLDFSGETIAWYSLWSDTQNRIWFLIGTRDDYEKAQKKGRVEPGQKSFD